jgi:hypothetical protein
VPPQKVEDQLEAKDILLMRRNGDYEPRRDGDYEPNRGGGPDVGSQSTMSGRNLRVPR